TTPLDFATNANISYVATNGSTKTANPTTASITDTNEGWSWDHTRKTLTLNGLMLDHSAGTGEAQGEIFMPSSAYIIANGTNSVIGGTGGAGNGVGIMADAYLCIRGGGTLNVVADSIGIASPKDSLAIYDRGTTVYSEARGTDGIGFSVRDTFIIKDEATVYAKGSKFAIYVRSTYISTDNATATGSKEPFVPGTT
ncbi:MAG: hypothetical protein RR336_12205, partial [Oscillospiraceae bacterium]